MNVGDQRWTHVCSRSTVAAHNCEDQQWLHMYVSNQMWLGMYVWGSMVATKCMLGINGGRTCSMVVANINYVLSTIA